MGVRQRAARRAGLGCLFKTSRVRENAGATWAWHRAEGRRRESGHRGTGMMNLVRYRRSTLRALAGAVTAAAMMVATSPLARAQPAPLPDKPFAEHRIVLQLSDNDPKKQSLVAQGVRFDVCLNTVDTIERDTGKRPDIIPVATPVQVGVGQILSLTENGYTLVRP